MLVAKKWINLKTNSQTWVEGSLRGKGLSVEPLSIDILFKSTQLGEDVHGDPADRMILSTAK